MLIGAVSSLNSPPASFHPVLAQSSASDANSAVTALPAVSKSSSASSSTVSSPAVVAAATKPSAAAQVSSSVAASSSALVIEELVSGYSTTVGKDTYSASVDLGDGEYTASIPNLVGATATASTEQTAETNLALRIDTLV